MALHAARVWRRRAHALAAPLRDGRARSVRDVLCMAQALGLFWHFLLLGCLAIGGVSTVMPDMHRYVVEELGLVSAREFADLYALAQAAPGPNALWVTLLGLQAAGGLGALATTLGVLLPATTFSL